MAIVMPALIAPLKKEAAFLLRYGRSRPRFKTHLAIDAFLSMALVFALFQVVSAPSRHELSDALKNSGAVAFSASDLQKFVHEENLTAFWTGPRSDYKYTVVATTPGEVTISYFPQNADIHRVDASVLVVQTHSHFSADEAHVYSQNVSGSGSFLMNQGATGNAIQYNPANPYRAMVTIKNKYSTVTIFNSVPEAALTLAMKPGAVEKVSQA